MSVSALPQISKPLKGVMFASWHSTCFVLLVELFVIAVQDKHMQSKIVAMVVPEGSPQGALLVRRANGQFAYQLIDVRVVQAARLVANIGCGDAGANQAHFASMT